MIEIDHEAQDFTEFQMHSAEFHKTEAGKNIRGYLGEINAIVPTKESISTRLSAPVTSNRIDMDKISFERNKSGIWGWRSDKTESINGYECKVYAASNVEFVTRTRSEHLDEMQARVSIFCSQKIDYSKERKINIKIKLVFRRVTPVHHYKVFLE